MRNEWQRQLRFGKNLYTMPETVEKFGLVFKETWHQGCSQDSVDFIVPAKLFDTEQPRHAVFEFYSAERRRLDSIANEKALAREKEQQSVLERREREELRRLKGKYEGSNANQA